MITTQKGRETLLETDKDVQAEKNAETEPVKVRRSSEVVERERLKKEELRIAAHKAQLEKMEEEHRKRTRNMETRRKIELGGLFVVAGFDIFDDLDTETYAGALCEFKRKIEAKPEEIEQLREIGREALIKRKVDRIAAKAVKKAGRTDGN